MTVVPPRVNRAHKLPVFERIMATLGIATRDLRERERAKPRHRATLAPVRELLEDEGLRLIRRYSKSSRDIVALLLTTSPRGLTRGEIASTVDCHVRQVFTVLRRLRHLGVLEAAKIENRPRSKWGPTKAFRLRLDVVARCSDAPSASPAKRTA